MKRKGVSGEARIERTYIAKESTRERRLTEEVGDGTVRRKMGFL